MVTRHLAVPVLAVWVAVLATLALVASSAAGGADFEFVNNASSSITEVYIADPGSDTWGSNVLSAPIEPGETRGFVFTPNADECVYDFHATFDDGNPVQALGWDLCSNTTVVFVTN